VKVENKVNNNRRDFIKWTGLAGAAVLMPMQQIFAESEAVLSGTNGCVLIPVETAGPFPLDLTANTAFFRKDIRETKTGVQLNLKLKIIGSKNCEPMQNVRVNIWHCDKDGLYSGYSETGNQGQAGLTYLRGYQLTDAHGEVEFITILPGWYNGRICHIHFQVYVSSSYAAISQLTFDEAAKNSIYAANPGLYTKGTDPMTVDTDNVFSDGYVYQMSKLIPNTMTGGYNGSLEVTVQGSGTLGVGNIEKETAKHFTLGQNFPNPYMNETVIPFNLKQAADVAVELWDLSGKMVATVSKTGLSAGEQQITLNMHSLGLTTGNYVYQIEVTKSNGIFRQCRMMTGGQ
jgi:protocatechuate 3,4-dioxygenase beta subunit